MPQDPGGVVPFSKKNGCSGSGPDWMAIGIMAKELTPIILSSGVWDKLLS